MTRGSPRGRPRPFEAEDPSFYEALGRAIKVARTEQGLSRKELAEAAGVSYPYVADIESGRGRPSSNALLAIAGALGMSPSELMARAEDFVVRMQEPEVQAASAMARARGGRWFHEAERVSATMASPPAHEEASSRPTGREELHRLIDRLPDEDLPLALELARRLLGELPPNR